LKGQYKILLRGPTWVGDAIMAIPTMRAIRYLFPDADITLLARPGQWQLFLDAYYIDHMWSGPEGGLREWLKTVRALRRRRFDLAVLFPNSFESALLAFLGRARKRVGYARDGRSLLLTDRIKRGPKKHQVLYYLELARALSFSLDIPKMWLRPTNQGEKLANELLASVGVAPDNRYMVLNPGAAFGSAKRWGADRFAECADTLGAELDLEVVIIGSDRERPIAEDIRSRMKRWAGILNGKTTLDMLMGVIQQAKLVITNDSGPMHIAAALGTPTVAIFGATDDSVTGPWSKRARVVREAVDCSPCMLRECPIDHRCMTRVTADAVCRAAREVIQSA